MKSKDIFIDSFKDLELPRNFSPLILLLSNPCNGFGDIVFASKIANYLREWYSAKVHILSTRPGDFKKIGELADVYGLDSKSGEDQCRRFKNTIVPDIIKNTVYELIFVAPLQADYKVSNSDVKAIIPYSNSWNTYWFSEYNDSTRKHFDFNTGIGRGRLGLLFTSLTDYPKRRIDLPNPYVVCYIAETITRSDLCFMSFMTMVMKKYGESGINKLDIVAPEFISNVVKTRLSSIPKYYYSTIRIVSKKETYTLVSGTTDRILTIRTDIYPVPNIEMKALMIYSLDDILVTGDQSLTDALSCCSSKNLWYQQADWKKGLARNLTKLLPQKYFKHRKTTCGTIQAVSYKSNYDDFYHTWDFRVLGRAKLDNVIKLTALLKSGKLDKKFLPYNK